MNVSVKCAKSTASGKKYFPSRGPTKHRRGPFTPKRGYRVPKRTFKCLALFSISFCLFFLTPFNPNQF